MKLSYPCVQDALGQLQTARATLGAAALYRGGHRLRATARVDRSISEVRAGMVCQRGY